MLGMTESGRTSPIKQTRNLAASAGRWSAQHRKKAILGWLAFVILAVVVGGSIGQRTLSDADYGTGESGRADKTINKAFPEDAGESVLVQSKRFSAGDPEFEQAVAATVARIKGIEPAFDVTDPLDPQVEGQLSKDGHSALVTFELPEKDAEDTVAKPLAAVEALGKAHPGFRIEEFGDASADKALSKAFADDFKKAEITSLPITLVILILAFGALLAAFVPLLLAITAVVAAIGLLGPISHIWPVDESISSIVLLIGLAVGVDYSMFYLRREREERARGRSEEAALEAAAATSGRAVLVSGITVMIAMAGMYLGGDATFLSFATGTILVVAISVIGSLTVLPAVLSKLGDRVNKGRVPFLKPESRTGEPRVWGFVIDRVLKRPVISFGLATAFMVVLALPLLHIHTADSGVDGLPRTLPIMQTYDRMQAAFPGETFSANIVVQGRDVTAPAYEQAVAQVRQTARGSELLKEPVTVDVSKDERTAVVHVPLAGSGTDDTSNAALDLLRDKVAPQTVAKIQGAELVGVGGFTAGSRDFNDLMQKRIWIVLAFVFAMAFMLLLVTFRSIVIPIKAILLNALSVSAALGVVTYVFQDGHFEDVLNFRSSGAVTSWFPLMLFVILFGLSMDYHVFILSRIREAVDRGETTDQAVAHGIKSTAGVITAAAAVMVGVFSIFATLSFIDMKQFGVGLAVAVLIDATVVRGVMLPAAMKLLGEANWYLPRWLEWLPKGPSLEGDLGPVEPEQRPEAQAQRPQRREPVGSEA
jgi:uncharacterized membrane protein YdfJ with MMPL/SSD domain